MYVSIQIERKFIKNILYKSEGRGRESLVKKIPLVQSKLCPDGIKPTLKHQGISFKWKEKGDKTVKAFDKIGDYKLL